MFGYVIANLEGLTQPQKDRYKGCYCGLCRVLKQRHGFSGRLTLTYDMTFLVLLLSALLTLLLAVAAGSVMEEYVSRQGARAAWVRAEMGNGKWEGGGAGEKEAREQLVKAAEAKYPARVVSDSGRVAFDLVVLLVAIGGVSWLTMA